ncbi:MAG: NAD(P)/FAD-dependent oxidoreductase [Gammaproteobacteria bacterium]
MTISTDALIIGAGPVGLFQVFELGLLGIRAHVVDTMPQIGGQCAELYPDKPIYDIPAIPVCSGQELVGNLLEQIKPFAPDFHLGQEVAEIAPNCSDSFYVRTHTGTEFRTRTIIIAGGVGSFRPRRLNVEGARAFEGVSVHYRVKDISAFEGKDIVVLGGGDSALDWALDLYNKANSLVLVHRSQQFRAAPASVARMRELCDAHEMQFLEGDVTALLGAEGKLSAVAIGSRDGVTRRLELDALLVLFGLSPKLGPISNWGLELDRKQILVDTEKFQTNVSGIFAVGDINTYPGKKKLILSGFHEAALAAFGVQQHINPDKKVHLQYTTTSPIMHERLGVKVRESAA